MRLVLRLIVCSAALGCLELELPAPTSGGVKGSLRSRAGPMAATPLTLTDEGGTAQTLTTDAEGAFGAQGLRPGLWSLSATVTGFLPLERTFSVTNGATRDMGVLQLYSEAPELETAGTVTGRARVNGADDSELRGGTVEALVEPSMQLLSTAALGASGLFALQLPPGTYSIRVSHPFFVTALAPRVAVASRGRVELPDDALVLALNPGRVTGRVLREIDGNAPRVPAANVVVSSDTGSSTTTAMDGTFDLGGLPGGARGLRLALAGLRDEEPARRVTVQPGQATSVSDLLMALERGDVVGSVEMGDGSPLRDVTVFVDGTSYSAAAVPSSSDPSRGTFRIAQIPVGTYSLTAVRTGYRSATSGAFTIEAGRAVTAPSLAALTRVQGDFVIDDLDPTNTPGFSRRLDVLLIVNNPTGVAAFRAAASAPDVMSAAFRPFAADGGTAIDFQLPPGDGEKTVFLQLRDAQGNAGAVLTASVVLDTAPPPAPTLRLGDGSGFVAQANPLPFSLVGTDASSPPVTASGIAFMRLAGASTVDASGNLAGPRLVYQRDDSFTRPTSAEGPVSVSAQLIDNAGNVGAVVTSTVVVDTTGPTGTLVIERGAAATQDGFTREPLVTLRLSSAPEPHGGQVRVRLANELADVDRATPVPVAGALAWFVNPLADGAKTVHYRFVDSAGNLSAAASATIVLDRAPPMPLSPSTSLAALASPSVTNSRAGSLTVTVGDDRALSPTTAVVLTSGGSTTSAPPTSPTTVTGSVPFTLPDADGPQRVELRFQDAAGNVSATVEFEVTLDRVAPSGRFTLEGALADGTPSSTVTATPSVRVLVTSFEATGVFLTTQALPSCPAAGPSYVVPTSPSLASFPLGVIAGSVNVRGCVVDAAGNTALLNVAAIEVDGAAPSGCALQLSGTTRDGLSAPAGRTASASVAASLTGCTEGPAELFLIEAASVTCAPTTPATWIPVAAVSPLALSAADGTKTLRGCVRDAARNVGSLAAATITLDTTAPTGASLVINDRAAFINASQVTSGLHTASLLGAATGAVEWAVGTTASPTNFVAFPGTNPRAFPVAVSADGSLSLFARFRDDLGNEAIASAAITVDLTLPSAPSVVVRPTGDVGFVNTEVVTAQLGGLSGAAGVRVAEALSLPACTAALGSAEVQPPVSVLTFVLSSVEGGHVVCAQARDAAGNLSPVGSSATVTLDKTPPTRPVIVTPDGFAAIANGGSVTVDIATASTDTFFRGYQRLGGTVSSWTDVTPSVPPLRFSLAVVNDGSETGTRNELRLRAVDRAGNASAESSVLITADTNPPEPAGVDVRWVDNSNRQATVYWQAPASPDVERYDVFYGGAPVLPLGGTYATEGVSPLRVAATGSTVSATLSGLANESTTYVQVVPIDRAGNRAPADAGLVALQPNEVSPNLIASLTLDMTHAWAMEQRDGFLYVAGSNHVAGCSALGEARLHTYDVRRLVAPVQGGVITASPAPTTTSTLSLPMAFDCQNAGSSAAMDLALEPPWLFLSLGPTVRIFDVSTAGSPSLKATLSLPSTMRAAQLEIVADTLLVVGASTAPNTPRIVAVNVASLFDNNATTFPALPADELGTLTMGPFLPGAVFTTRDVLLAFDINSSVTAVRLADALDRNVATVWDLGSDAFAQRTFYSYQPISLPVVSGNYAYHATFSSGLALYPLNSLWASTLPATSGITSIPGYAGGRRIAVEGDQIFLTDLNTRGLRAVDLRDPAQPLALMSYDMGLPATAQTLVFGNYAAVLTTDVNPTAAPTVSLLELSTPRNLSVRAAFEANGTGRPEVRPGFIVNAGLRSVHDLHTGELPIAVPVSVGEGTVNTCQSGFATFDDVQVQAAGNRVRVVNLAPLLDRDAATTQASGTECAGGTSSNDYCLTHPVAGTQVHDVVAWGNALVVAETRASGQQVWLEAFDARPLKDRNPVTPLSLASPIFSFLVHTAGAGSLSRAVALDVSQGIAVLTMQENPTSTSVGGRLFAVDVRAAFDDNAATTVGASSVQADFVFPTVPVSGLVAQPRFAKLSGDTLYVASNRGLWAFPAAEVTDGVPATVTNGLGGQVVMADHAFDDLAVHGSTLVAAPGIAGSQLQAIVAFDTSASPTTLRPLGSMTFIGGVQTTCTAVGSSRKLRAGVTIAGSKAYVRSGSSPGFLRIVNLE